MSESSANRPTHVGSNCAIREISLPVERIFDEAKRWGVLDEVAVHVVSNGLVRVSAETHRARLFVEHIASVGVAVAPSRHSEIASLETDPESASESCQAESHEWERILHLASAVVGDDASGRLPDATVALNLAQAVLGFSRPTQ